MKTPTKFGRQHAIDAVQQILLSRAKAQRVVSPQEAEKLSKILTFSGKGSKLCDLAAIQFLESFSGEFVPLKDRKKPAEPRKFSVVDMI